MVIGYYGEKLMKKKLKITFLKEWVFRHRNDDMRPIELVEKNLAGTMIEVKERTHEVIIVEFDDTISAEAVELRIITVVRDNYPKEVTDGVMRFEVLEDGKTNQNDEQKQSCKDGNDDRADKDAERNNGEDGEETDDDDEEEMTFESLRKRFEALHIDCGGSNDSKRDDTDVDGVLKNIDGLVGVEEFKALAREIVSIADEVKSRNACDVVLSQSYLFSIGDGSGLSTCLELLSQVISAAGIKKLRNGVLECRLLPVKESMEPFEPAMDMVKRGDKSAMRILCIDVSEWMNNTWSGYFRRFLQYLEKNAENFIYVFRIPFVEKDVFEKMRGVLNDMFYIRAVSFPPFTLSELEACAKTEIEEYGFKVQKRAWKFFDDRINTEKSDGKFYGLKTVKKVVRELLYKKQLSNALRKNSSSVISAKDMSALCDDAFESALSGEEQLARLVGNEAIKTKVREIIAQIEMLAYQDGGERPCIHMRFVGNPGTGKTTVARIVGKILKERGILQVGGFYEHSGRDFCGRYIGETAPKTLSICRDAYGSVLFIDEAYSLYRGGDDTKDFGREALDTLIAEMENHRKDFVVIMAGYTDDMEVMMKGNAGLASRMPYTVEFPNFTKEELFEIYKSMVVGKVKYDDRVFEAARDYFNSLPDDLLKAKEFSNARFVRNLFERTFAKASMRCQLDGMEQVVLTKEDFDRAVSDKEFIITKSKRTRIGFDS